MGLFLVERFTGLGGLHGMEWIGSVGHWVVWKSRHAWIYRLQPMLSVVKLKLGVTIFAWMDGWMDGKREDFLITALILTHCTYCLTGSRVV